MRASACGDGQKYKHISPLASPVGEARWGLMVIY